MATLPTSGIDLSGGVTFERQPSKTWRIDPVTKRIQGEVEGLQAVKQAVEVILNVERFRWPIYRPYTGTLWNGLIGEDLGYVAAELQRRIREALMVDDRVTGLSDFTCSAQGESLIGSFHVNTIYGDTQAAVEVTLS